MKQHRPAFFLQASKSTIVKARVLRKRMTPEEKKLWSHLRANSFGVRFRRQVPFGPFILDFLCFSQKIVIELDGDQHFEGEAIAYDKARDEYLQSQNLTVLRFRNKELKENLNGVLTVIWDEVRK